MMEKTKICVYCKEEKVISLFPKHYSYKYGVDSRCRLCVNHHQKIRAKIKRSAPPKPENNLCPICEKNDIKLVVDHCHETEKFRGYICDNCNRALGMARDDTKTLRRMISYLEEPQ